jgi:hypothetical protein
VQGLYRVGGRKAGGASLHFSVLLLQPRRWRLYVPPKHWHQHVKQHTIKTQNIIILTTMKASNIKFCIAFACQREVLSL